MRRLRDPVASFGMIQNDEDRKVSKETAKKTIKQGYVLLSSMIAFFTAVALWLWNVAPGWSKGYFGFRTLFVVGILYTAVYTFFARMYDAHKIGLCRLAELLFSQMLAFAIADIFLFVSAFFWFHDFSRIRIGIFFGGFVLQFLATGGIIFVFNRLFALFDEPRRILVVYGDSEYRMMLSKFEEKRRYHITACLNENIGGDRIFELLKDCQDVYLINVSEDLQNRLLLFCDEYGKDIHLSMSLNDLLLLRSDISHSFDTPFLRNKRNPVAWYYPAVKRLADVLLALIGLIVLSPVMLLTSLAIRIQDSGPVFYRQKRMTTGGKEFWVLKFRSMRVDAEKNGARLASEHDDRITPVGRFIRACRIDELPQLINILMGDMSIVGPRPERPEIAAEYEKILPEFRLRLKVKAGLTGYAQVYGKYNTTPQDKLRMDLIYIRERSLLFDLQIIFYTLKILFIPESTEGIGEGQTNALKNTMEKE